MKSLPIHLVMTLALICFTGCEGDIPSSCRIVSPQDGAEIYSRENISIQVHAEDPDDLTELRLYIDDELKEITGATPYFYDWNIEEEENGIHFIKAIALFGIAEYVSDEISIQLLSKEPPGIAFSANKTSISVGDTVQFTDQSTNKPTDWQWDFGDGQTSVEQNPSHVYIASGAYTVALTAKNQYGQAAGTETNYVKVTDLFTDTRDGKTYRTITIGEQVWLAENLAYLPSVNEPESGSYSEPHYYVHGYEGTSVGEAKTTKNFTTYGVLYNWPAAMEAAPDGWHLPTDEEWKELEIFLGMEPEIADEISFRGTNQGSKLAGNADLWPDGILIENEAFNSTGFMALPGGYRLENDKLPMNFLGYGYEGKWWASSGVFHDTTNAWVRELWGNYSNIYRLTERKDFGYAVRTVKD